MQALNLIALCAFTVVTASCSYFETSYMYLLFILYAIDIFMYMYCIRATLCVYGNILVSVPM